MCGQLTFSEGWDVTHHDLSSGEGCQFCFNVSLSVIFYVRSPWLANLFCLPGWHVFFFQIELFKLKLEGKPQDCYGNSRCSVSVNSKWSRQNKLMDTFGYSECEMNLCCCGGLIRNISWAVWFLLIYGWWFTMNLDFVCYPNPVKGSF